MKTLFAIALSLVSFFSPANKPVPVIELNKFAGKWYSLYSIPTMFDKNTQQTTTMYTLNKDGYYNVLTEAHKDGDLKTYRSKLFPVANVANGQFKAQFLWPFKVDYWVIEVADDYSYVVVGHPDKKFLFIMSRKPEMDEKLHEEIVARCKAKGYDVAKLTSQHHHA
ncbi:lipocalin family protein [Mucilaginibacter ginkgonis]|uniref:Lipocalin family protein n=1 Tax=Mucilaginibacter ginkgonis TaxID=2682091 RepID=A0A6I4I3Q4_9SPHI|nr:lipocalin family protein [Mucilaginibacter ginkgonis]QQL49138.1 lipocalin family protein [Mucilaginibacter ginkgonis]